MKSSELETMRKSFNTVKRRSDSIKNSPATLRLKDRVREIKSESIKNNEYYFVATKYDGIYVFDANRGKLVDTIWKSNTLNNN